MKSYLILFFILLYIMSVSAGCFMLLSNGETIERLFISDAPYARSPEERDRIITTASATRLGLETYPSLKYISACKSVLYGLTAISVFYMLSTVLLLFYSNMNGALLEYAAAFISPIWILAAANIINPVLKLLLSRISATLSFVLVFRPFDWHDPWQVFVGRMDVFFIAYLIMVGIGCSATAKIRKCEAVMLVAIIWFAMYFSAVILGIDLAVSF